ncbi:MAG: hypothetical protein WD066_03105 [Planctomycetaceae bacterium]
MLELPVEEVDFCDEHDAWLITVGFWRELREDTLEIAPVVLSSVPKAMLPKKYRREYKIVEVDAASGDSRRDLIAGIGGIIFVVGCDSRWG